MASHTIKFSLLALLAVTLLFGVFAVSSVFAQEEEKGDIPVFDPNAPAEEVEPKVIATTEIYDMEIVERNGNELTIEFDLYNDQGVQPQIRYAVDLIRESEVEGGEVRQELMDRHVYDETISLGEGERRSMRVTYMVPEPLNGTFQVWVVAVNNQSLLLAISNAGEVEMNGDGYPLSVPPRNCKLSISGSATFYEKIQGPDLAQDETLRLHCDIENTTENTIEFTPQFTNYYRSSFGRQIGDMVAGNTYTLGAGESEEFVFDVPKAQEPQSYDFGMTLTDATTNETLATTIYAHYVVRGMSGTIQTVVFDKDSYKEGDIAQVFVNWTGRADAFPGSRGVAGAFEEAQLTTQVVNGNGSACSDETTKMYPVSENATTIEIPITRGCNDPQLNLTLADSDGNVLAQATFSVETQKEGGLDMSVIITLVVALAALVLAGILYRFFHSGEGFNESGGAGGNGDNGNNMKTYALFLPLLFTFGLGLTTEAHAITFSVGGNGGEGYYTASLNKSTYEPSETSRIYSSGKGAWCDNGYQNVEMDGTINGNKRSLVGKEGYANGFNGCPDDPQSGSCLNRELGDMSTYYKNRDYTVQSTAGNYNARLVAWGANQYEHNSNFRWVTATKYLGYTVVDPLPSVSLTASPNPVDYDTASTLSWNVSNADQCTASGDWSGSKSVSGGTESTGNLTAEKTYNLQCTNDIGSNSDSVIVAVNPPKACQDGIDNDGDGLVDMDDPQCTSPTDNTEDVRQCSDGIDNDGDGWIDYPDDPGCDSPDDNDEFNEATEWQCSDLVDNDEDGLIDGNDPGCLSWDDDNETAEPDFLLKKTNDIEVTIVGGISQSSNSTTISALASESFSSDISLSVTNVSPEIPNATYTFGDSTLDASEYGDGSTLQAIVPGATQSGEHVITVRGSGGGLVRTIDVILTVQASDPEFEEF